MYHITENVKISALMRYMAHSQENYVFQYSYTSIFFGPISLFITNYKLVIIMDRNLHTLKYLAVFHLSLTDICESLRCNPSDTGHFFLPNT